MLPTFLPCRASTPLGSRSLQWSMVNRTVRYIFIYVCVCVCVCVCMYVYIFIGNRYVWGSPYPTHRTLQGYYATWFEVFSMVDGKSDGATAADDRRVSQEEWEVGLEKVVKAGLSWAPFAALRSATKTSFGQVYTYMYIYIDIDVYIYIWI